MQSATTSTNEQSSSASVEQSTEVCDIDTVQDQALPVEEPHINPSESEVALAESIVVGVASELHPHGQAPIHASLIDVQVLNETQSPPCALSIDTLVSIHNFSNSNIDSSLVQTPVQPGIGSSNISSSHIPSCASLGMVEDNIETLGIEDRLVVEPAVQSENAVFPQLPEIHVPRPCTRRYVNLTHGQWSDAEVESLAHAELALGEVYSVTDVLATKFTHRSKESIEKMRKMPRYLDALEKLQLTHTSLHSEHYIEGPSYSHCRWADSELIALAKRELELGGHRRINEALHAVFGSRTVSSISQVRRTKRYQDVLELLKSHTVIPPTLPSFSGLIPLNPLELSPSEIRLSFTELGVPNEALISALVSGPTSIDDLRTIYNIFGVKRKTKSTQKQIKVSQPTNQNRSQRKRARYVLHQRLYHLGPKVLADHLLIGDTNPCSLSDLHKEFDRVFDSYSAPLSEPLVSSVVLDVNEGLFTEAEVAVAIRLLAAKSAPGPDNVSVTELLKIPPSILTHIFNNWLAFGLVPLEMKQSRTVFIPKKANPQGPGDFRPISVSPVLFRLFTKLLLCRLSASNSFHKFQSGFADDRSTSSNLLVLQGIMRTMKLKHKPFFCISLDLRKAFDSVSHSAIFSALEARQVPIRFLNLIKQLYVNCTTTYSINGETDHIRVPLRRGIKQGDPLSPFLFNCILDPLLFQLNGLGVGVPLGDVSLAAMAFADDMLLMSDTLEGLQLLVDETVSFLANVNLQINPSKSQYFGWRPCHQNKGFIYAIPPLNVAGHLLSPKDRDEPIRYLGINLYVNKNPRVESEKAFRLLDLLSKASLKPFQKIHCLKQLVVPIFLYGSSNTLDVSSESTRLDGILRKWVKQSLRLPGGFPNLHIWLPSKSGGLGVLQLQRVSQALHIKGLARLLRLGSSFVDKLFENVLNKNFIRISALFEIPAGITASADVNAALQRGTHKWWARLKGQYTNRDLITHQDQTLANKWLCHDSKLLKDGDKIRGLRLRTNLYPTRALTNKQSTDPASRLCRRCGEKPETAFHICQECESVHLSRTERHNYVSRQVARLIRKRNPALTVREEPRFTTRDGVRLKPDLVIESDDQVMVIDLAIVWDANEGVLRHKAREKGAKYSVLKDLFDRQKGFSSCGMVFGARSMVCRETVELGLALGFSRHDLAFLSASVLRGSLICLNRFRNRV